MEVEKTTMHFFCIKFCRNRERGAINPKARNTNTELKTIRQLGTKLRSR